MPLNEALGAIKASARAFSYTSGAEGAEFARAVAIETPVNLVFGGAPFAVMMATPTDLEDFAVGFALTEGIIGRADEIRAIDFTTEDAGIRIKITLTGDRMSAHLARGRAMAGRTGCGLCGIDDLKHLPKIARVGETGAPIAPAAIGAGVRGLDASQPLNTATRAVHGAAWCDRAGAIVALREDVGRHNALDKLIGALLRQNISPHDGFFIITSRCSFEMVAKAAIFGASTLVCLSAPTSLALERARACGLSVIAIARADQATSFAGPIAVDKNGMAA